MEPVTTVTTAWTIAKTASEISKKLYELGKSIKDREVKQHVDELVDRSKTDEDELGAVGLRVRDFGDVNQMLVVQTQ